MQCPVCDAIPSFAFTKEGCDYLRCPQCDLLFHRSPSNGPRPALPTYDGAYWEMERQEALRRERGYCFARALDLIYLSEIPVARILDFGCGQAETVRLLRQDLGVDAAGVDPHGEFQATPYLHKLGLDALRDVYPPGSFDAIYSIEVFEHLEDPKDTLAGLLHFLKPGGKILINTATQEYIARFDPDQSYIDPLVRGHISIYSLKTFSSLAQLFQLQARFLAGSSCVVLLEPTPGCSRVIPIDANRALLAKLGEWFPTLFDEYMRLLFQVYEFGEWALMLDRELKGKGEYIRTLQAEFETRTQWVFNLQGTVNEQQAAISRLEREARGHRADRNPRALFRRLWGRGRTGDK